ncbi:hypothetical protein BH09SUM1_BH09SUM1_08160 [soil metagenome]
MASELNSRTQAAAAQETPLPIGELPHGYLEGVRAFCEGDYSAACRRFQALLPSSPRDARLLAACGHACFHGEDRIRAAEFYERAEASDPHLPDVLYCTALLHLKNGEPHQAIPKFRQLLAVPTAVTPGSFYLGLYFRTLEEFLCDVALYLGQVLRDGGNVEEARRYFNLALEKKPDSVTALQRIAEVALLGKSYIEAIRYLNQILENSPLEEDRISANNNLGIAYYENGNIEEAITHLTSVLRQSPTNPSAIHNLNFIYEKEGIFRKDVANRHAFRFMDVEEGALPIFQLTSTSGGQEGVSIVGRSAEMLRVMRHSRIAAANNSPVMIHGENGTGKELLAQLITLNSSRRDAPFIVINCASMPEVLLESELFGHEKGAFTGARAHKAGALERAQGGTLFLDEVAALTPMLQGKLHRALQEGKYYPLGASQSVPLDIRIIVATNRDLSTLIRTGGFREDLYYQLNVVSIEIPPLRDRREDIPLLVDFFLHKHNRHTERLMKIPAEDLRIMMEYDWPGNVRELENLVERAIVLGSQSNLYLEEMAHLRRKQGGVSRKAKQAPDQVSYPLEITLADLERRHILSVLENVENNQRQAARMLGINPSTLWRKLKGYGIDR